MMITCTLEEDLPQQAVDLFAALKEVIAAKFRAAIQKKFSSPNRLSLRACVESYPITENNFTFRQVILNSPPERSPFNINQSNPYCTSFIVS